MTQEQKIFFELLPIGVRKAITLLQKMKEKAIKGVGYHGACCCPIATAYSIRATSYWSNLAPVDMKKLERAGWEYETYRSFLNWYDSFDNRSQTHSFLLKALR